MNTITPQEKAKELFDKYCFAIRTEEEIDAYWTNVIHARECALIAVDEVLLACALETKGKFEYYLEVKKEIEKL